MAEQDGGIDPGQAAQWLRQSVTSPPKWATGVPPEVRILAGRHHANLVVQDRRRGPVLLRFSQYEHWPYQSPGALRPPDTMEELARLGIPAPRLLFAADLNQGSSVEVHEYVKGVNLYSRYPMSMASLERPQPLLRQLPPRLIQQGADLLGRLAASEPTQLRARYPDAPRTCWEAHHAWVDYAVAAEAAQWERFGDALAEIGLHRDFIAANRSRFELPANARDQPTRLVHFDIHRSNFLLAQEGLVLVDVEGSRLNDPAHDASGFMNGSPAGDEARSNSCAGTWTDCASPISGRPGA